MGDLISRSALMDWINEQREEVTKKQVVGTDGSIFGSIFTREVLVTMQRCLSTFENAINNQPTAYDVEKVVKSVELLPVQDFMRADHIPRTATINQIRRGGNCELP